MFSTVVRLIPKLSTITLKLTRITHFPKTIFYISIYLIIIILLIDVVRFCLKMSLSGDSSHTEICQAHQLPCVCVMGVFTEWHYQTGNRSKILLLFNLFLNILSIFKVLGDWKFTNVYYLLQNWCQSMM